MKKYPDCYLYVYCCHSGQKWVQEIKPKWVLDLKTRLKYWIKKEFDGELALNGELMPKLEGDYYARIMTDGRPPDSVVCWESGGFYLKFKEEG